MMSGDKFLLSEFPRNALVIKNWSSWNLIGMFALDCHHSLLDSWCHFKKFKIVSRHLCLCLRVWLFFFWECLQVGERECMCVHTVYWCVCMGPHGLTFTWQGCWVYIFDINQLSLPTPFYSVLVSISVFMAVSTVFHSMNAPETLRFLSLFFRSYICLIGPFNYTFFYESIVQHWYNPSWLTGLKAPTSYLYVWSMVVCVQVCVLCSGISEWLWYKRWLLYCAKEVKVNESVWLSWQLKLGVCQAFLCGNVLFRTAVTVLY